MKALFCSFIILFILTLTGCPGTPADDPNPVEKLPMCFYAVKDNSIIKSVKVFEDNGEVTYFACGLGYEFSDSDELGDGCNLNGKDIYLEDQSEDEEFGGPAKEVGEYCMDDPISGACERWNCYNLSDLVPYPSSCQSILTRRTGNCLEMWGEL